MIICVDGGCSGNPGPWDYRGKDKETGEVLFYYAFPWGTNNIAEYLAIVHALGYCVKNQLKDAVIYSDSVTAIAWVRNGKHNSQVRTHSPEVDAKLNAILRNAELFLAQKRPPNLVLKWDTATLGENPADFGRK